MLTIFIQLSLHSQPGVRHACFFSDTTKATVYDMCNVKFEGFHTYDGIENLVKKITGSIGLKPNFILVPCPNIQNCAALIYDDNLRYIVYDKPFMDNIAKSVGTNWSNLMILTHEIGHHLNGHTLIKGNKEEGRNEELEADEFAGFILGKMGANIKQAIAAMDGIPHPACDVEYFSDHPCKIKRVNAIKSGWTKATGKKLLAPTVKQKAAQRKRYPVNTNILLGSWYTELDNERKKDGFMPLVITFSDSAKLHYRFFDSKGDSVITEYDSRFEFDNGVLAEVFPNFTEGKASIEMLSQRAFLLTIIRNGEKGYEGLKRVYVRKYE